MEATALISAATLSLSCRLVLPLALAMKAVSCSCVVVLRSELLEMLAPRFLQDHSPTGEPHYTATVQAQVSSGELLVNDSELRKHLVGQRLYLPDYCSTALNRARCWREIHGGHGVVKEINLLP
ncbi:hypothetical protein MITS9509_03464 [Synechococcus sp. MIT S9509]|nr:hypothetical protein MITS9504_03496 [Synechococcus sp. MIT S9504]KZR86493.1 hypothetical protein MITS9509_03464 [Synechococcus sp. MIT S9509]